MAITANRELNEAVELWRNDQDEVAEMEARTAMVQKKKSYAAAAAAAAATAASAREQDRDRFAGKYAFSVGNRGGGGGSATGVARFEHEYSRATPPGCSSPVAPNSPSLTREPPDSDSGSGENVGETKSDMRIEGTGVADDGEKDVDQQAQPPPPLPPGWDERSTPSGEK